ncbi:MAG TPA: hypothetical protein VLS89_20195, partial [Candidatus Nanopelagicales bacterium]|nr:hypothetical protein [Candidatus Nanopelagicales bacterium]
ADDDAVRLQAVPAITAGITAFTTATTALDAARTAKAMASTRLDAAEEAWERQIEKVYGALLQEIGRSRAERFFPRKKTKTKAEPKQG